MLRSRRFISSLLLALLFLPGCGGSPAAPPAQVSAENVAAARQEPPAKPAPPEEIWDAYYLQGAKLGYGHTVVRHVTRDGQPRVEYESINRLSVERFGQASQQDLKMTAVETPDGRLVEFRNEISFGPMPVIVTGRVQGDKLLLETQTQGRRQTSEMPWSNDIQGFRAVESSLEKTPLRPGEKRSFKMLMPIINQVAEVELVAGEQEVTDVLGAQAKLLKIDSVAKLPGNQSIASTIWTDAQGRSIKTRVAALEQESYRTTRELALAKAPAGGVKFDLGSNLIVKVEPPLKDPHAKREIRYRVELAGADPAKTFASGPTQSVRSLDEHAAEVTVRSIRPGEVENNAKAATVGSEYTSANSILQIDDARIQAMAREAKGELTDPREIAEALEKYVRRTINNKNFSQGFATAAEVAETREGDCTEHAVLLAALARAVGIPSRVAIGLVWVDYLGGFGFHMWSEVYLDGQWIPLDGTLGQGGIGAGHLKLTDASLDGAAAYSSFLSVANVAGQLKISVVEEK